MSTQPTFASLSPKSFFVVLNPMNKEMVLYKNRDGIAVIPIGSRPNGQIVLDGVEKVAPDQLVQPISSSLYCYNQVIL